MNKREIILLGLFALVVISALAYLIWMEGVEMRNASLQKSKTIEIRNITVSESSESEESILKEAQRSLDRSLSILNTVATLMGGLIGLLTLIIIIAGYFGIMEIRNWRAAREEMKKSKIEIEKCAQEVSPIVKRIRKAEEDVNNMRSQISLPPLTEILSEEMKKKMDEFARKIEFLEAFGVPLKAEDYFTKGNDFYYRGNYDLSLKAYEKAIEIKPDFTEAWDNKGVALSRLGRYEDALKAHEKAIELKPDYANAWDNKGVALSRLGRYEDALKAHEKAIELKPDLAEAWNNKGVTLIKLGRYDDSLKAFMKAIEITPRFAPAWYNKACTYSLRNDKENMLENLRKAIEISVESKNRAKKDEDFKNFWEDEDFKKMVS